jgi:hypothetical protein
MGRNRDVYIVHGEAADNYCGRVLVGLPVNHENFAVSHADFVPITADKILHGGIKPDTYQERERTVNN